MKSNSLLLVGFLAAALMCSSFGAEGQAPASVTPAPAGKVGAKAALTKTELRKLIENTEWESKDPVRAFRLFFHRDGKITGTNGTGQYNFYTVEAPDILRIYFYDPAKDRKAAFTMYRINVSAMIAENDVEGSTKPGGERPLLTYVGPAKGKK